MMEADRIGPRLKSQDLFEKWAERNLIGIKLERVGKIDEAIDSYKKNMEEKCDTLFTYRRLAILFRKQGKIDEEIRVLKEAKSNKKLESTNPWTYDELVWRLKKIMVLKDKEKIKNENK